jgi:hypothetical protein
VVAGVWLGGTRRKNNGFGSISLRDHSACAYYDYDTKLSKVQSFIHAIFYQTYLIVANGVTLK